LPKLALDEWRHAADGFRGGEKRREVLADDAVEHRMLGGAGTVRHDRAPRAARRVVPRGGEWRHAPRIIDGAASCDPYE
jgi:hypothetical protein